MRKDGNKGKATIVIGAPGHGKSRFVNDTFLKGHCMVYDVQDEYTGLQYDNSGRAPRCRVSSMDVSFEQFVQISKFRKNTNIIYEEATGFFRFRASGEMMKLLISKRHGNNNLVFIFHSIKQVPKDIFELCNYIVLFKTADLESDVEAKRPELVPYYRALKKAQNHYAKAAIKLG